MIPLRNPTLYAEEGTSTLPGAPALRAVRSKGGQISFPPQHYGCQLTGDTGDDLTDVLLTGRGRLNALATVHMHAKPVPQTPFTVVEVALDDGPIVRGILAASQSLPVARGTTLVTCFEEMQNEAGETVRDLRFAVETSAANAKEQ